MADLPGERRLQVRGGGDELRDSPDFRAIAGGHHDSGPLPIGDQGRSVGHVAAIRQDRVGIEDPPFLLNRHRFSGKGGFVDLEIPQVNQPHVGGHLIARLQQDQVARHHLRRRDPAFGAGPHHRCFSNHGLSQRGNGFKGLGFLQEADNGIHQHDAQNDPRIHPFLQQRGHDSGHQQNVDEWLVELQQKAQQGSFPSLAGDDIGAEPFLAVLHLKFIEAPLRMTLQQLNHRLARRVVPVFCHKLFHNLLLLHSPAILALLSHHSHRQFRPAGPFRPAAIHSCPIGRISPISRMRNRDGSSPLSRIVRPRSRAG